jgi:hypothetical protein
MVEKVLVIGASTGFGLASRIASAFGSGASTIGVFFENHQQKGKRLLQVGTILLLLKPKRTLPVFMPKASMATRSQRKSNSKHLI